MFLFVTSEILGLFVTPSTYDAKYSLHNTRNLLQPIKMHLSQKPNTFSGYFIEF